MNQKVSDAQVTEMTRMLYFAIETADMAQVELCLEKGANPNAAMQMSGSMTVTPLEYAVRCCAGDTAIISEVIRGGGDPLYKSNSGWNAFDHAKNKQDRGIMKKILNALAAPLPTARDEFRKAATAETAATTEKEILIKDPFHLAPQKGAAP